MSNREIVGGEVYKILHSVRDEEFYMIPKKITDVFEKYKKYGEKVKIDYNKSFEDQNISKEAKDIIFAISLNYWLTEKERQEVFKKMEENERIAKEKYDVEKIFKTSNSQINNDIKNKKALINVKENWFIKLINSIKTFIKKFRKN